MTLLNGLVLGLGGLLLTLPIILHFLMRPRPKEYVFPALRFIRQKQTKNRRQMRVRHFLLLLLRCLLILALALALAGPTVAAGSFGNWMTLALIGFAALIVGGVLLASWLRKGKASLLQGILAVLLLGILVYGGWVAMQIWRSDSAPVIGDNQAPIAVAIVIDSSPRMLLESENQSSLSRAKETADWLISQFPADSQVSIIPTDGEPAYFSVDVSSAKKRLETTEINYTAQSVPTATVEALRLIRSSELEQKEVYVLSDMTLRSWADAKKQTIQKLLEDKAVSLYVIDAGVENAVNVSVNAIRLQSSTLTRNSPLKIEADLVRRGPAAQRSVRMSLEKLNERLPAFRNGEAVFPEPGWELTQLVDLAEDGGASIEFNTSQKIPAGIHHGKIEIVGDDGLSIDNQKYFTIEVRDAWRLLLVHPPNVRAAQLAAAIEAEPMFQCDLVLERDFSSVDLNKYSAVYWMNPTPQSDTTWSTLTRFIEEGHGVGFFLGHNAQDGPAVDSAFTTDAAEQLFGTKLTFPFVAPRSKKAKRGFFLAPDVYSHPVMQDFRSFESNIDWTRYQVFLHWGVEVDPQLSSIQTILRYSNRAPALFENLIGEGKVLVLTTPIPEASYPDEERPSWNYLFRGENFPTWFLVRQMTLHLVGTRSDTLNLVINEAANLKNDDRVYPEQYTVFTPDPEKPPSTAKAKDNHLRYKFTDQPGHYRFRGSDVLGSVRRGFSVNLSPSDTDLARVPVEELDLIFGEDNYQFAKEQGEVQRKQGAAREGQSFYPMLIFLMLVILAVEYLMSNRFYSMKST